MTTEAVLPKDYRPSEAEPFMNLRQLNIPAQIT